MHEAARDGNAGCVVHAPWSGRTRVTVLFSGATGDHPSRPAARCAPVSVGHAAAGPPPGPATARRTRRGAPPVRTRRRLPRGSAAGASGPPAGRPPRGGHGGSRVPRRIGRRVRPRAAPVRHTPRGAAAPVRDASDAPGARCRGSAPAQCSPSGCAPGVTGFSTHNRLFQANFTWPPRPSPDGRTPRRPPGRNGPRGTLSPDADGPPSRRALPCALREWNAS